MIKVFFLFLVAFSTLSSLFATQNYDKNKIQLMFLSQEDFSKDLLVSNTETIKKNRLSSKSDFSQNSEFADCSSIKFMKFAFELGNNYRNINQMQNIFETRNSIFYMKNFKPKGLFGQFFMGDYVNARMSTFENTNIPFLTRGSGISTEVSTKMTNLSTSYFKSNKQSASQNTIGDVYQKANKAHTSDTKLALAVPYLPQLKLFGGYSYNRNNEARLTKGPSFGFQASIFQCLKIDTTFVKQREGKTSAKVLFSLSMPTERLKF
jgi:hypothetical protein